MTKLKTPTNNGGGIKPGPTKATKRLLAELPAEINRIRSKQPKRHGAWPDC